MFSILESLVYEKWTTKIFIRTISNWTSSRQIRTPSRAHFLHNKDVAHTMPYKVLQAAAWSNALLFDSVYRLWLLLTTGLVTCFGPEGKYWYITVRITLPVCTSFLALDRLGLQVLDAFIVPANFWRFKLFWF